MANESIGKTVMVQGRIVWLAGDLFKGKVKTDFNTRQVLIDPKTGSPKVEYGFGLAVPKSILGQAGPGQPGEIWTAIHQEAYTLYPSQQLPPGFAMKYKDGDGIDDQGKPFNLREGYAGHLVFACTTTLPIKFFKFENGNNILINEGIKCGDYVNVQLNIKAHPPKDRGKAGLYLNPNAVQFLGFGKEIINTPSGDAIFGTQAPPMPSGASATPLVPQAGMLVPPSQMAGYAQPPQAYPQPQYQQPQATPQMPQQVQPHYAVVPVPLQPQQPPMMPGYAQPMQPGVPQGQPMAAPGGFPPAPGIPGYQQ